MGTVYVFFADGFEEIEAFTSVDVMRRAGFDIASGRYAGCGHFGEVR